MWLFEILFGTQGSGLFAWVIKMVDIFWSGSVKPCTAYMHNCHNCWSNHWIHQQSFTSCFGIISFISQFSEAQTMYYICACDDTRALCPLYSSFLVLWNDIGERLSLSTHFGDIVGCFCPFIPWFVPGTCFFVFFRTTSIYIPRRDKLFEFFDSYPIWDVLNFILWTRLRERFYVPALLGWEKTLHNKYMITAMMKCWAPIEQSIASLAGLFATPYEWKKVGEVNMWE